MRISDWSSDVCSSDLGVDVADIGPHHLGDVLQRQIADRVAIAVVDLLEVVDVQDQQRQRLLAVAGVLHQPPQVTVQVAPVVQAGQKSEEHTSELQSLMRISYAVFCLKKKKITQNRTQNNTNTF